MNISIKSLYKTFYLKDKKIEVLKDLNFDMNQGEIFALMGANGSGKTTLLKIISSLIIPDSGEILLDNTDILKHPDKIKRIISLVHDSEHSFYQVLTIKENLLFFGRLFKIEEELLKGKISYFLSEFKMRQFEDLKFNKCSSGMKQKTSIIRALLNDPKVLLLDEPTRSLDDDTRNEIKNYLKSAVFKKKMSCIFVTHDKTEAKELANRTGCLRQGKICI